MPRELKTYGCDFRCGYLCTKRQKIVEHEPNCFRNPARKACRICKHNTLDRETGYYCALELLMEGETARIGCPS